MNCPRCGNLTADGHAFCQMCGLSLSSIPQDDVKVEALEVAPLVVEPAPEPTPEPAPSLEETVSPDAEPIKKEKPAKKEKASKKESAKENTADLKIAAEPKQEIAEVSLEANLEDASVKSEEAAPAFLAYPPPTLSEEPQTFAPPAEAAATVPLAAPVQEFDPTPQPPLEASLEPPTQPLEPLQPQEQPLYPAPDASQVAYQTAPLPPTPAAPFVPATINGSAKPKKKKKGRKVLIGILAGLLVVVLGIVAFALVSEHNRSTNYNQAIELMEKGNYEEALAKFRDLGDYQDSTYYSFLCSDHINYEKAQALIDAGDYEGALKLLNSLGDFEDSTKLATLCENHIDYAKALELQKAGKYKEALVYFDSLAYSNFLDADVKAQECEYSLADILFNEDKRYEAYNAFMLLGDYSDAAARAQACIVPITSSKEVYRNPDFSIMACDFTITSNSSTALTFLKIYNGDTLVSSLFITPGSSLRITLPVNTYKIRAAVGENWFGDSDLFGDDGYYYQMEFDDSGTDTMVFETNYSYTLDLQVSEGGNVSSKDLDWDTF